MARPGRIRDSTKPESVETVARRMWTWWRGGDGMARGPTKWEYEGDEVRDTWRAYARAALDVQPPAIDEACRDAWAIERVAIFECLLAEASAADVRSIRCTGTLDQVKALAAAAQAYRAAAFLVREEGHAGYRRGDTPVCHAAEPAALELAALATLIERPPLDDVQLTQDVALRVATAIRTLLSAREGIAWRLDRIREDGGPLTLTDKAVLREASDMLGNPPGPVMRARP